MLIGALSAIWSRTLSPALQRRPTLWKCLKEYLARTSLSPSACRHSWPPHGSGYKLISVSCIVELLLLDLKLRRLLSIKTSTSSQPVAFSWETICRQGHWDGSSSASYLQKSFHIQVLHCMLSDHAQQWSHVSRDAQAHMAMKLQCLMSWQSGRLILQSRLHGA